jgi:hypothetical protein
MKVFYTYERDEKRRPMTTRCLLIKDDKVVFGQAKCSDKDRPVKKSWPRKGNGPCIKGGRKGHY